MFISLLIANRKHNNWRTELNHFRHDITNDPYKEYPWAYTIAYGIEMQHYYTYGKLPRGRYRVNVSDIVNTVIQFYTDLQHGAQLNGRYYEETLLDHMCENYRKDPTYNNRNCRNNLACQQYSSCKDTYINYEYACAANYSKCIPKLIVEALAVSNYTVKVSDAERIRVYKISTTHAHQDFDNSINRLYQDLEDSDMGLLMLDMAPENQLEHMYNDAQKWDNYKFPEYTARQTLDSFFETNGEQYDSTMNYNAPAAYDLPGYLHLYSWLADAYENTNTPECIETFLGLNDTINVYKDYFMKSNSANITAFYLDLLENFSIFTKNRANNLKNPLNPVVNNYFTENRIPRFSYDNNNPFTTVLVAGKTNYQSPRQFWQYHFVSKDQYTREFYNKTFENAFEVINPYENSEFRYDDNIPDAFKTTDYTYTSATHPLYSYYQQLYNSYEEIIPDYESFANISYWHFPTDKCIAQDRTGGIMTTVGGMHELLDKIPAHFAIPYLNPHDPVAALFSNFSVVDVTPEELRNVVPEPLPESSSSSSSSSSSEYNDIDSETSNSSSSKTGVIIACSVVGGVILIGGIIVGILLARKHRLAEESSELTPDAPDAGKGSTDSLEV